MAMSLREKCPYSELFWSVFSRIRTECGPEQLQISPIAIISHLGTFNTLTNSKLC